MIDNEELNGVEFNHSVKIQIRFNDVDLLGHVNNSIQIQFLDYGKIQYFDAVQNGHVDWRQGQFVIVNVNIDYLKPIKLHDKVNVQTKITQIGNKSIKMLQAIVDRETGEPYTIARCIMCAFDMEKEESMLIPQEWRDNINRFEKFRP